jgi:hypothetical protein
VHVVSDRAAAYAPTVLRFAAVGFSSLALLVAAPSGASPTATSVQGDCHVQSLVVLFWPQGHPAINSVGFPAFPLPHVEVYAYQAATTFMPQNQVGYTGTDRKITLAQGCRRVKEVKSFNVLPAKSIRAKAAITCSFSTPGHVQLIKVAGAGVRSELRLVDPPNKLVLRAQLAPQGSNLSYSRTQCRQGKAPG